MWQVDAENTRPSSEEDVQMTEEALRSPSILESPVFIKDFGYIPVTTLARGTDVFLDQGDADQDSQTLCEPKIEIVDGSEEVLEGDGDVGRQEGGGSGGGGGEEGEGL
jgi:hypothetical protein